MDDRQTGRGLHIQSFRDVTIRRPRAKVYGTLVLGRATASGARAPMPVFTHGHRLAIASFEPRWIAGVPSLTKGRRSQVP